MNKSVIIAIVVIAALVVGVPLIGKVMQSSSGSSSSGSEAPVPTAPPGLDATSLTNTQWSVKMEGRAINVTFLPNGVLQAQSPLLKLVAGTDTVSGTWAVNGADLDITAAVGDKTVSEKLTISGDQILVKGSPAQRLK